MEKYRMLLAALAASAGIASAIELHDGDEKDGTLPNGGQVEYTFTGQVDDRITLFANEGNIYSANKFTLTIYDPGGSVLYAETDAYGETGTRRLALNQAGTYRVVYQALSAGANYTLFFHNEGEAAEVAPFNSAPAVYLRVKVAE